MAKKQKQKHTPAQPQNEQNHPTAQNVQQHPKEKHQKQDPQAQN